MKTLKPEFITLEPSFRLYNYDKPIVALTGGIATGKSTVTKLIEAQGLEVIDADQLVKSIYQSDESKMFIQRNFSEAWSNDQIDFHKLRELFFHNPKVKEILEVFIYTRLPDVFRAAAAKVTDQDFYVYDVPLLFERHLDTKVDQKIVVYAPRNIQKARLLDRDSSREEVAEMILNQQMDIEEKKSRADLVIDNSGTVEELRTNVDGVLRQLLL